MLLPLLINFNYNSILSKTEYVDPEILILKSRSHSKANKASSILGVTKSIIFISFLLLAYVIQENIEH